jgi:Leucine-rich repeat (LRR) protein
MDNTLYLSDSFSGKIPEYVFNLTQLTLLYLSENEIKEIPNKIENLTSLEELTLNDNSIKELPKEVGKLTNLKKLYLSNNKISKISDEISKLTNLTILYLDFNCIQKLNIQLLNLEYLNLSNNKIEIVPDEILNSLKLKYVDFSNNKIKKIPNEIFGLPHIKSIKFSKNQICEIPAEIKNSIELVEFYIDHNKLKSIPIGIINCIKLNLFIYQNNQIEFIPPQVVRFLNKRMNTIELELYNDGQNIHNHSIQQSIMTSISRIMTNPLKTTDALIMNEILADDILTSKTKELLIEYSNNPDYHSVLFINFKELLLYVWELIKENKNKDEIKKILNNEILEAECKCFTGRLTRLLNSLNGFNDLIEIKISDNQQIGNIIILIKNELDLRNDYTIEKHKQLVMNELRERGYDDKIIEEWIGFI